jgi:hypothetical protein
LTSTLARRVYLHLPIPVPQMRSGLPSYVPPSAHDSWQVLLFQGKSCSHFRSFTTWHWVRRTVPSSRNGEETNSRTGHQRGHIHRRRWWGKIGQRHRGFYVFEVGVAALIGIDTNIFHASPRPSLKGWRGTCKLLVNRHKHFAFTQAKNGLDPHSVSTKKHTLLWIKKQFFSKRHIFNSTRHRLHLVAHPVGSVTF